MLENVEEDLDPSLEPVLLKQVFKRGGQNLLHLGDSDVPYSGNFRFYITTKLANPHYMPEICIKVTIINFTVTLTGLEDQLLVDVVRSERPDLEQKKNELTVNIAADKKQLKEIEDKILYMLENSKEIFWTTKSSSILWLTVRSPRLRSRLVWLKPRRRPWKLTKLVKGTAA